MLPAAERAEVVVLHVPGRTEDGECNAADRLWRAGVAGRYMRRVSLWTPMPCSEVRESERRVKVSSPEKTGTCPTAFSFTPMRNVLREGSLLNDNLYALLLPLPLARAPPPPRNPDIESLSPPLPLLGGEISVTPSGSPESEGKCLPPRRETTLGFVSLHALLVG